MKNDAERIIFDSWEESIYVTARVSRGVDSLTVQEELKDSERVTKLVESIIKLKHLACTEHYTLFINNEVFEAMMHCGVNSPMVTQNLWFQVTMDGQYVMCNPRFLIEMQMKRGKMSVLEAYEQCKLFDRRDLHSYYKKQMRHTVHVTTNIGCTREFNRHRSISPLEQSTRYLTMTVNDLNFTDLVIQHEFESESFFNEYHKLVESRGRDFARDVLPLGTVTKCYYTAFPRAWFKFFGLRRNPKTAHPMIHDLADKIHELFTPKLIITDEDETNA